MRPQILNPLFKPVSSLQGIGPKMQKTLDSYFHGQSGQEAVVADLLFHFPARLIDRRNQPDINQAIPGEIVTLKVHIDRHIASPRGRSNVPYRVYAHDETGEIEFVHFKAQSGWMEKLYPIAETRYVSGRLEEFNGRLTMPHPDIVASEEEFAAMPKVEAVYPGTAGISRKLMQKAASSALASLPQLPEWGNASLLAREDWPSFSQALSNIHHAEEPLQLSPTTVSRKRLAYDEYLAGQLALALMRQRMTVVGGVSRQFSGSLAEKVKQAFSYSLTASQKSVLEEIETDIKSETRMLRLLQGDVGSGKTIVALCTMANIVESGAQAALMAPTEILARQHYETIAPLCEATGIRCAVLTGRDKGKKREEILARLSAGAIDIIIGTHALFQASIQFKNLGIAIVDEQHRFGVYQRLSLGDKGAKTEILVMTATPIPRTLVMTAYGDMEVSKLTEKPAGRQPIQTSALSLERLDQLIERTREAINSGKKIFWICPLVDESEELPLTSAIERRETLQHALGIEIGLVHGQMPAAEKDSAMEDFRLGKTRMLVATTVIEVGVDVPDATIMVIEHAERFGLAQLHQLRGRVGRGNEASHCILLYKAPLSQTATARINTMRETEDGFRIAEEDLRLRGEGELLGTRQSGTPGHQLANAEFHGEILEMARDDARMIITQEPELDGERGSALRILLYLFSKDQAIRLLRSG